MSRCRIERKAPSDPAGAARLAASHLVAIGYQPEGAAYGLAQLAYAKGSAGARFDEAPHTVRILHEQGRLIFEFSTGLGSSSAVTAAEQDALEKRVDAALRATPEGVSKVGCRFCGFITDASAPTCDGCGSSGFV